MDEQQSAQWKIVGSNQPLASPWNRVFKKVVRSCSLKWQPCLSSADCINYFLFWRSKQDELVSCRSANTESLQISKIHIHFKDTMVYSRGFATPKIIILNFFFLPTHNACHVKGSAAILIPNVNIRSWLYQKFSNCFKSETRSHKVK